MKITFITGAANGLGKEFAVLYGKDGNNLLLVDIDAVALESVRCDLCKMYPDIIIDTFIADLSKEEDLKTVYEYTLSKEYFVNNVVNAAGFGDRSDFKDMDVDKQLKMTYVDCNAVLYFSRVFIDNMLKYNEGHIINVASIAAFMPAPYMCTYHACKSYVLLLGDAISYEIRKTNVKLLTLCPVPFLSKSTGYSLADIATEVIMGKSLKEQGIFDLYPEEKKRWYVKVPVFSFNKLRGLDAYLSPEMKSTGEAIGYDDKYYRALYKALQASGMHLQNYGTVFATIADCDKEESLPLIRRFYNLGFNIEATEGTARFLKENGIRTHVLKKLSDGSEEIADSLRQGHIAYVINTSDASSSGVTRDGFEIRRYATENNVTVFTSLDTVRVLLDVLEETTLTISTIDA